MKLVVVLALAGCSRSGTEPDVDAAGAVDANPNDVGPDATAVDKSAPCVGDFGNDLTDGFGRLDGFVVAVVPPGNTTCPKPNSTHLILEVRQGGEVYRMVTAMKSSFGNPDMALAERAAPLVGPPWQEGWHPGVTFDYVTDLDVHRLDLAPLPMQQLAAAVTAPIELGAKVSVYATVENQRDSAHLVHRNGSNDDGAIVVDPTGSPRYLLLRFDNQLF